MSMDKSTRVNRSIVGQVELENPRSFSNALTGSGLRASFLENFNGTSSEKIVFRGEHCDGPGKTRRRP